MALFKLKEKVTALRRQGLSYGEIIAQTGATKSSISNWCKDVYISEKQRNEIAKRHDSKAVKALMKVSRQRRKNRIEAIKTFSKLGDRDIGTLSKRDLQMVGLGLYWGEGYKNGNEEFGFTNSDPRMISFFLRWLKDCYDVEKHNLILRISINEIHRYRMADVEGFWIKHTKIPREQFSKMSLIKSVAKKLYTNNETYYGMLRIKVRKGLNLRRRILGSIEKLSKM